jgi:hypothetical protein
MGTLTPGATYIYERSEGIIYAREFGADPSTRHVVGYESGADYDPYKKGPNQRMLTELNEVVKMCETDPGMKQLLDQLFVMYNLKKNER